MVAPAWGYIKAEEEPPILTITTIQNDDCALLWDQLLQDVEAAFGQAISSASS